MLLQRHHTDGGRIDYINIPIIFLVLFFNIADQFIKNQNYIDRIIFTIPFLLLMVIILFFKNNKYIHSLLFLIIAIGTTLDPVNISDYSGAIFFIYSFHLVKDKRYAGFLTIITVLSITIRSIIANDTIPGTLIMIAVYAYIYAIYYLIIYRQIKPISIKVNNLSETENKLLSGLASGQSQKTTIANMGLSQSVGYDTVKKIKEKLNSDSMDEIMFNLGRNKYSKNRQ